MLATALAAGTRPARSFIHGAQAAGTTGHTLIVGTKDALYAADLASHVIRSVPLGFEPHSAVQNIRNPSRFWAIEKWGHMAAEVDFAARRVTRKISCPEGFQFYGHGAFSPLHDALFIACVSTQTGAGHLIGFDTRNLAQTYDYPVTPGALHQCQFTPDGHVLVASAGARIDHYSKNPGDARVGPRLELSAIIRMDIYTGRIVGKNFAEGVNQTVSHFAQTDDGAIFALSSVLQGAQDIPAVYVSPDGIAPLQKVSWPETSEVALGSEMFSIAVNNNENIVAVTNPTSSRVFFFDAHGGNFLGQMEEKALGVAFDPESGNFIYSGNKLFSGRFDKDVSQAGVSIAWPTESAASYNPHSLIVPEIDYA